jgi:hypothetical protein
MTRDSSACSNVPIPWIGFGLKIKQSITYGCPTDFFVFYAKLFAWLSKAGGKMTRLTGILVVALLFSGVGADHATVRIADDRGGRIGTYVDKYKQLRDSGEFVVIDGDCLGACTIVLGAIPRDRICVTSNAKFGFHESWDLDANGKRVTNQEATRLLYALYPSEVRRWIAQHGGMTPHMIFLQGNELHTLYRTCSADV